MSPAQSNVKLGFLGGTSLLESTLFSSLKPETIKTEHGAVQVYTDSSRNIPIVFIQRHHADTDVGAEVYRPPHLINHRANIAAMKALGVTRIIAVCSVGSLSKSICRGTIAFPDDYYYVSGPPVNYYDDARGHIVPGIDAELRAKMIEAVEQTDIESVYKDEATYVQTIGPRFETKAEVRFLCTLGHVIGMTAASEATIAKELGLAYAVMTMIDNMANGLEDTQLTHEGFKASVSANQATVEKATSALLKHLA